MPIHPTATISPNAEIDSSVTIGPNVVVEGPARIGRGVEIMANAVICPWTEIGEKSSIHFGAIVGHEPQHLAYDGRESWTYIGKRTQIREYVTIHRGFEDEGETRIGDDVLLMALSHVGHDCRVGDRVIIANGTLLAGHVEVQEGAVLSGHCGIHQFARIGKVAMVGGHGRARKDVPPYMMLDGNSTIRGLNVIGMRRNGIDAGARRALRAAYKTLYHKGLTVSSALKELKQGEVTTEIQEIIDFIESSKRGISKHYRGAEDDDE